MLEHHIQRTIVYRLAFSQGLRFSELKPDTLENKLFTYHLKKVMGAGYVHKNNEGLYSLTPEGRRLGVHVLETENILPELPDSVLFLVIRRKLDGAWLLYRRKTHPLKGKTGFMHCRPDATMQLAKTAARECLKKTGITATFTAMGGGYFRVYEHAELESFTHFTLLVSEDAEGDLQSDDPFAEYYWQQQPDFSNDGMLPNMQALVAQYERGEPFFLEEKFKANP